jgi:hypothetical protein
MELSSRLDVTFVVREPDGRTGRGPSAFAGTSGPPANKPWATRVARFCQIGTSTWLRSAPTIHTVHLLSFSWRTRAIACILIVPGRTLRSWNRSQVSVLSYVFSFTHRAPATFFFWRYSDAQARCYSQCGQRCPQMLNLWFCPFHPAFFVDPLPSWYTGIPRLQQRRGHADRERHLPPETSPGDHRRRHTLF